MKKVLALALSLVIALSCVGMFAFADSDYKCTYCSSYFGSQNELDTHIAASHSYTCPDCNVTFRTATEYETHRSSEHKVFDYKCTECSASFATAAELETHMTNQHSSPVTEQTPTLDAGAGGVGLICPYCGRLYGTFADYNACITSHRGAADGGDQLEFYFDKYVVGKDYSYKDYQNQQVRYNGESPLGDSIGSLISNIGNGIASAAGYGTNAIETGSLNSTFFTTAFATLTDAIYDAGAIDNTNNLLTALFDKLVAYVNGGEAAEAADGSGVAGACDDLLAQCDSLGIAGTIMEKIKSAIDAIKEKIKSFYAGEKATIAETEAEAPADTGSSATVGVAAFAAVSVACAAAFVCLKKKND